MIHSVGGSSRVLPLSEQKQIAKLSWCPDQHKLHLRLIDLVPALVKAGATVAARYKHNGAVHFAASGGVPTVIRALHKAGADFQLRRESDGAHPLHLASSGGRADGVSALLKLLGKDAEPNVQDQYGWTPLHYFADKGGPQEIVSALKRAGADPTASSTKDRGAGLPAGVTPAQVAAHWKDTEAATWLTA